MGTRRSCPRTRAVPREAAHYGKAAVVQADFACACRRCKRLARGRIGWRHDGSSWDPQEGSCDGTSFVPLEGQKRPMQAIPGRGQVVPGLLAITTVCRYRPNLFSDKQIEQKTYYRMFPPVGPCMGDWKKVSEPRAA
jgi:hypothetical protein